MQLNQLPTIDCLFTASRLQRQFGGFAAGELHLFAYIGCLLSLYRKRPFAEWGYVFVSTEFGAPFSRWIENSIQQLLQRGAFVERPDRLQIVPVAANTLTDLLRLEMYRERLECLNAAVSTASSFSPGIVRTAISNEPELLRTRELHTCRTLLEEPARELIYEQFQALHEAVGGESTDLRIPAVAWLTALFNLGENHRAGGL